MKASHSEDNCNQDFVKKVSQGVVIKFYRVGYEVLFSKDYNFVVYKNPVYELYCSEDFFLHGTFLRSINHPTQL